MPLELVLLFLGLLLVPSKCQWNVIDAKVQSTPLDDYVQHIAIASNEPIATGNLHTTTFFQFLNSDYSIFWNGNVTTAANSTISSRIIYRTSNSMHILGYSTNATTVTYNTNLVSSTPAASSKGNYDIVLAFFSYGGDFQFHVRYGSIHDEQLLGLATDSNYAGIFACGVFEISTVLGTAAPTLFSQGMLDMWLAKYDDSGNHVWSQSFGGPNQDRFVDLAVNSGRIYVAGNFLSSNITFGSYTQSLVGSFQNGLLINFDDMGDIGWILQGHSSSATTTVLAVALDQATPYNIYIVGIGQSVVLNTTTATSNSQDAFLFKVTQGGTVDWGVSVGTSTDVQQGIDVVATASSIFMLGAYTMPFTQSGISVNSSSLPSAFISQHLLNGSVASITPISIDGLSIVPYTIEIHNGDILVGGSIAGTGNLPQKPNYTTSNKDAVLFVVGYPSPSPMTSRSPSPSLSSSPSAVASLSRSPTPSKSPSVTPVASVSPTPSDSPIVSASPTESPIVSVTPTSTFTPSVTPFVSASPTESPFNPSSSPTPSVTPSTTATPSTTVAPSPSATTSPSGTPDDESSIPVVVIAGSAAGGGGGCLIIVVVGAVFWCRKRKKPDDSTETEDEEDMAPIELS